MAHETAYIVKTTHERFQRTGMGLDIVGSDVQVQRARRYLQVAVHGALMTGNTYPSQVELLEKALDTPASTYSIPQYAAALIGSILGVNGHDYFVRLQEQLRGDGHERQATRVKYISKKRPVYSFITAEGLRAAWGGFLGSEMQPEVHDLRAFNQSDILPAFSALAAETGANSWSVQHELCRDDDGRPILTSPRLHIMLGVQSEYRPFEPLAATIAPDHPAYTAYKPEGM